MRSSSRTTASSKRRAARAWIAAQPEDSARLAGRPAARDPWKFQHLSHREEIVRRVEDGPAENLRDVYGGKGSGLIYMAYLGVPTRDAFIIPTDVARRGLHRSERERIEREVREHLAVLEADITREDHEVVRFGDPAAPLLLAVRGGSVFSMPGMLATMVFVGMTDAVAEALAKQMDSRVLVVVAGQSALSTEVPEFGWMRARFTIPVELSDADVENVTRRILVRLRSPSQRKFDRASSLTVAVTANCDAGALVSEIASEIARFGSTKHLSSDRVDRVLNRTAISQASTDNVGVTRYLVDSCAGASCADFTQDGTPSGTSYTHSGLVTETSYRYRVQSG